MLEASDAWDEEGDEDLPADDLPDERGSAPRRHERKGVIAINEYFADHPEMVLGTHGQRRGIYGPGLLLHLPAACRWPVDRDPARHRRWAACPPPSSRPPLPAATMTPTTSCETVRPGTAADGATIKEGSFLIGQGGRLSQILGGVAVPVSIKDGRSGEGISSKAAKIIRGLLPIRDAIRDVLRAQATGPPLGAGAGQAPLRLFRVHPLPRTDQPHRRHHADRRRDRRRTRGASPPQPGAVRG